MASTVSESGGVKIITEVLQATDPRAEQLMPCPSPTTSLPGSVLIKDFRKAQPKALGTIQIVAGITQISFGIALTIAEASNPAITVTSGVYFWIGFLLTVSGSLLVETEKRDSTLMVQACCIISTLVIVASLVATIIHGVEISQNFPWCPIRQHVSENEWWCQSPSNTTLNHGVNAVFVLLCLLEMSTAIAALVYGRKAIRGESYTQMVL